MDARADILLKSEAIFTYPNKVPFAGFVAIKGKKILAVGEGDGDSYVAEHTRVLELGSRLICPGFTDAHCFFTGYLLTISGVDLSQYSETEDVLLAAAKYGKTLDTPAPVLIGRNIQADLRQASEDELNYIFAGKPTILFLKGGESCWMNQSAKERYGFTPQTCWSESYWRLLRDLLADQKKSIPAFKEYHALLNAKGITSTKEMGFDDFYGFTEALDDLEEKQALNIRVHFMSQPVGAPMNLDFGLKMREKFQGSFVRFSGFNQMTDGSISQMEGDLKQPYQGTNILCVKKIDWAALEKDTLTADALGMRFSLHTQGDGAIAKTLDIFEKCERDSQGKLVNRHAMTDLEFSDPVDLERMGRLGVIAEIYPQIMSIYDPESKLALIEEKIGTERGKFYWNRRKMVDAGVLVSCATDLPLLIDDIPESVYHSVAGRFSNGGEAFNPQNTLTIAELLSAWTFGGQYNLGCEEFLGTLEAGKLADITVLDGNLFTIPMEEVRNLSVCLTLVDGEVVFQATDIYS